MNTKMKQLIGIGAAVCVLILVAGWFLLISPKKSDIKTVNDQTAGVQAQNATLQQQILQLTQQQQGLINKQVELSKVAQRIPSTEQLPSLIRTIETMSSAAGVDVVTITPGTPTGATSAAAPAGTTTTAGAAAAPVASYSTDPIALTIQGNYSQTVMFLDKLENLQRLWLVKSINVSPLTTKAGTTTYAPDGSVQESDALSVTITGEVYQTSADTTSIDIPALQGAAGTASASAVPSSSPTTAPVN